MGWSRLDLPIAATLITWHRGEKHMAQSTPLQFDVPDMDCQSCVRSITEAVHRLDAGAQISADLATKRVVIGGTGEAQDYAAAIEAAGFSVKAAGG
jgi:copper chaperone